MLAALVFNSARHAVLSLAVILCGCGLAAWFYGPQIRLLNRPWKWILPTLRIAGLVGLGLSIVQPVVRGSESPDEHGAVVILVDRSKSMSVKDWRSLPRRAEQDSPDGNAAATELVDLADSLGKLPAGARDESAGVLLAGLDKLKGILGDLDLARKELDFANLSGRGVDAATAKVAALTAQARDLVASLTDHAPPALASVQALRAMGLDKKSPKAIADAVKDVRQAQTEADRRLYLSNEQVRQACDDVATESRFDVIEQALTGPAGLLGRFGEEVPLFGFSLAGDVQPVPLRGNGRAVVRLGIAADGDETDLTGALRDVLGRLQSQPVSAVVIFSDGRQTGSAADVFPSSVPVFSVIVPTPGHDPAVDVAVTKLTLPASPFVGQIMDVRAEVRGSGQPTVRLEMDGKEVARKEVSLDAGGMGEASFPLKLEAAGIHRVAVVASPLADEATEENNRIERSIKVLDQKVKVAAVAGSAGWDFQYVRNCLARTPWVTLDDAIVSADAPWKLSEDQIGQEQVILLFNVPVGGMSAGQWEAVSKLVKTGGGGVIFAGGDSQTLTEYAIAPGIAGLWPFTAEMRPIWRTWPGKEAGFHLTPAPEAKDVDALNLGEEDVAGQWGKLPAFFRYLPIPSTGASRKLLMENESGDAVLTDARAGRGRVLVFGADETWRWREKIGERDQDRFWLQLVRYAAGEPYAVKNDDLALDAEPVSATPGQSVKVRGKISSATPPDKVEVSVNKGDQVVKTVQLSTVDAGAPGEYEGVLNGLDAGDYVLKLAGTAGDSITMPLQVAASDEEEMMDISPSIHPLGNISAASGGAMVGLDQLSTLPERIAQAHAGQTRVVDHPLWDSAWLFLFVLACFALEWALRKRLGLA